jgi:hypothetical protein
VDLKVRKCKTKGCTNEFIQYNSLTSLCVTCAIEKSKKIVAKNYRFEEKKWKERKKVLKEKTKTVTDYRVDARYWFQRWIRIRDLGKNCISCNTILTAISKYDAGHFYSANAYPQLLFNEFNVNSQCVFCNQHKSGNLIEYRKGIINRYGLDVLFSLEKLADDKTLRTLNKDYYIDIANHYKKRCKELEK